MIAAYIGIGAIIVALTLMSYMVGYGHGWHDHQREYGRPRRR